MINEVESKTKEVNTKVTVLFVIATVAVLLVGGSSSSFALNEPCSVNVGCVNFPCERCDLDTDPFNQRCVLNDQFPNPECCPNGPFCIPPMTCITEQAVCALLTEGSPDSPLCHDDIDNDGDNLIDCADSDCQGGSEGPPGSPSCSDTFDNDCDGAEDDTDSGCQPVPPECDSIDDCPIGEFCNSSGECVPEPFNDCGVFGPKTHCVDVSPTLETFSPQITDNSMRSVFGKILSLAVSADGQRLYAGAYSGVWSSDDGGETWVQLTRPQPTLGTDEVPGALLVPNVYDLAVSPENKEVVLAATGSDTRVSSELKNGIYRSSDGGKSWDLVHQFHYKSPDSDVVSDRCKPNNEQSLPVGQVVFAPGNPSLVYAAGGCAIAISEDGGLNWVDKPIQEGTTPGTVWHVAAAPRGGPDTGFIRRVYAAGPNQIWYSQDGGNTWSKDKGPIPPSETCCPNAPFGVVGDFPSEGFQSSSARILAVEPGHPDHLFIAVPSIMNGPAYFFSGVPDGTPCDNREPPRTGPGCGGGTLWLGDYSAFSKGQSARWARLPGPPAYQGGGSTPSGRVFVAIQPLPPTIKSRPYLIFFGDSSHVHVSLGRPKVSAAFNLTSDWHRLDGRDASQSKLDNNLFNKLFVHVDPHALVVSENFNIRLKPAGGVDPCDNISVSPCYNLNSVLDADKPIVGTIWLANDGGVYRNSDFRSPTSSDDGMNWKLGNRLATLQPQFPFAGVAIAGKAPAFYFGGPDNDNFFSLDGGNHWSDPFSGCGDCGAWFANPAQSSRVVEFNRGPSLSLYINNEGGYPNAGVKPQEVPLPSGFGAATLKGYRPLILTTKDENAPSDSDFVLIRLKPQAGVIGHVLRTKKLSEISNTDDWNTTGGPKVFQQGPNFTSGMEAVDVVQVSGGHSSPVFYVGDPSFSQHLWRCASECTSGMSGWQQIVPSPSNTQPDRSATVARRFFVNPYDPNEIYIIDQNAIRHSINGGTEWEIDVNLDKAVTEDHRYHYNIQNLSNNSNTVINVVIKDMVFVSNEPTRFAVGNAGVFFSLDGKNWTRLLTTRALPGHPAAAYFDSISRASDPALYVAFDGRGILRLSPIPTLKLVNNLVSFNPLTSTFNTTSDTAGCPSGFVGKFSFDATLTNTTNSSISDLVVEVIKLTNGNLLQNANAGPGGAGAILTPPNTLLSPGGSENVPLVICLSKKKPFSFFVDVLGIVK